jgi:hypothetical protein
VSNGSSPMEEGNRLEVTPGNPPVVFMFQPTHYEVVTGEDFDLWQKHLEEKVGLRGLNVDRSAVQSVGSWSGCPTWDECDQLQM